MISVSLISKRYSQEGSRDSLLHMRYEAPPENAWGRFSHILNYSVHRDYLTCERVCMVTTTSQLDHPEACHPVPTAADRENANSCDRRGRLERVSKRLGENSPSVAATFDWSYWTISLL